MSLSHKWWPFNLSWTRNIPLSRPSDEVMRNALANSILCNASGVKRHRYLLPPSACVFSPSPAVWDDFCPGVYMRTHIYTCGRRTWLTGKVTPKDCCVGTSQTFHVFLQHAAAQRMQLSSTKFHRFPSTSLIECLIEVKTWTGISSVIRFMLYDVGSRICYSVDTHNTNHPLSSAAVFFSVLWAIGCFSLGLASNPHGGHRCRLRSDWSSQSTTLALPTDQD